MIKTRLSKKFATKLFNTLEVYEQSLDDSPYVLVENNEEFKAICRALNIQSIDIASVSDGQFVDVLALASITYGINTFEDGKGFVAQ